MVDNYSENENHVVVRSQEILAVIESNPSWLQDLICIRPEHYKRDDIVVRSIYKKIIHINKQLPDVFALMSDIADYNYTVIFDYVEKESLEDCNVTDLELFYNSPAGEDFCKRVQRISMDLFNEIFLYMSSYVETVLRGMLDTHSWVYLDNTSSSKFFTCAGINSYEYMVVKNSDQQLLLPSLHLDELEILKDELDDGELLDTRIEKRRIIRKR